MLNNIFFAVKKSDVDSNQSEVEQQTELMYKDNTIWTAVFNADKTAINNLVDIDPDIIHTRGAVGECPIHMLFLYGSNAHLEIARDLIIRFPIIVTQIYNKPVNIIIFIYFCFCFICMIHIDYLSRDIMVKIFFILLLLNVIQLWLNGYLIMNIYNLIENNY